MLLLGLALLPFLLIIWVVVLALRLMLSFIGLGGRGGRGLLGEIMAFHLMGSMFQRPEPVPVYHYIIQSSRGQVAVRQEGELAEGRLFVGNRVRLRGRVRGGSLHLESGHNETLETRLTMPRSPWRWVLPWALLLIVLACLFLLAGAGLAAGL